MHRELSQTTVVMLGLDTAWWFEEEMRLTELPREELRMIARQAFWSAAGDSLELRREAMIDEFAASVTQRFGCSMLLGIKCWQALAYPSHATSARLWIWTILLDELVQNWNDGSTSAKTPLSERSLVKHRLQIKDYLSHINNVRLEVEMVMGTDLSEWDKRAQMMCSDWLDIGTRVRGAIQNITAISFWLRWLSDAPSGSLEALQHWGRALARAKKMPLRYASIPQEEALSHLLRCDSAGPGKEEA